MGVAQASGYLANQMAGMILNGPYGKLNNNADARVLYPRKDPVPKGKSLAPTDMMPHGN